ncbi:hypothetical protein K7432_003560 [Basidiobolus ranarum]|uniref:Uncharacterized protein n=1 Tax=Basidiobolus ranarum TaxID=34480 RepID=A0ABR2WZN5_9FUNG
MPLSSRHHSEEPTLSTQTVCKNSKSNVIFEKLAINIGLSDVDLKLSNIFEKVKQQVANWGEGAHLKLELVLLPIGLCNTSEKQTEGFSSVYTEDEQKVKLENRGDVFEDEEITVNDPKYRNIDEQLRKALDYAHHLEEIIKRQREEFSAKLEKIEEEATSDNQELQCMKKYYQSRDEENRLQTTVENNLQSQLISSLNQKLEKAYQRLAKFEDSRSKSKRSKKLAKKHSYDENIYVEDNRIRSPSSHSCAESSSGLENLFLLADQTLSHVVNSPPLTTENIGPPPTTPAKTSNASSSDMIVLPIFNNNVASDRLLAKRNVEKDDPFKSRNEPDSEHRRSSESSQEDTLPNSPDGHFSHSNIPETPKRAHSLMLPSSSHVKKLVPKIDMLTMKPTSTSPEFLGKASTVFKPISPLPKKEITSLQMTQNMSPLQQRIKPVNSAVASNTVSSTSQFPFTNPSYPGIQRKGRSPYVKWTPEEDALLRKAVAANGCKNWEQVAKAVPGRSYHQCRQRWIKVLKNGSVQANYGGRFLSTESHSLTSQGPVTPTRTPNHSMNVGNTHQTPTPGRKAIDILPTPPTGISTPAHQTPQHPIAIAPKPPVFQTLANVGNLSPPLQDNSSKVFEERLLQGPVMGVFPPSGFHNTHQENDGNYQSISDSNNTIQSPSPNKEGSGDLLAGLNALASVSTAQSEIRPRSNSLSLMDNSMKRPRLDSHTPSPETKPYEQPPSCNPLSKILQS